MKRRSKRIFPEIRKSQKRRKSYAAHSAHERPLLCIKPVRPDSLVAHKMQLFISDCIISFLKYSDIVHTALVKILVVFYINGINLNSDHSEILPRDLTCLSDILNIRIGGALSRKNQDFFHSAVCDDLHFVFNLLV